MVTTMPPATFGSGNGPPAPNLQRAEPMVVPRRSSSLAGAPRRLPESSPAPRKAARDRLRCALSFAFAVAVLLLPLRSSATELWPPGDHTIEFEHDGRTRSALVRVPPAVSGGDPLPLVLNLHGGGSYGEGQRAFSGMDPVADAEGFVVAYPDGTGLLPHFLTWNAGTCCGYALDHGVDDVGFLRALVVELGEHFPLDGGRVYASGMSNGAMMAYRLAVEAPDLVAAIAPVAGGMVTETTPSTPVPLLHVHSIDDPRALYFGGVSDSGNLHPNIEEVIATWRVPDGCSATLAVSTLERGRSTESATHTATRIHWTDCADGAEVAIWVLSGAGHVWPGEINPFLDPLLGPSTDVIDANREIWTFLSRFQLSQSQALDKPVEAPIGRLRTPRVPRRSPG